jgi:hypothetical protein
MPAGRQPRPGDISAYYERIGEFGAFLGEHAAYLIDPLEVHVAEAVQPVTDFGHGMYPEPAARAIGGRGSISLILRHVAAWIRGRIEH